MQFLKFLINGVVIGILAWLMQGLIFRSLDGDGKIAYAVASCLTYLPLIILNFLVQRAYIFKAAGAPLRFVIANAVIMALVSLISPLCWMSIAAVFGTDVGKDAGFIMAALIGALPSFLLSKFFVFKPIAQR